MMLVAPVLRTTLTNCCIPAAWYATPEHVPPFFQHVQAAVESLTLSGYGSLSISKRTALFPLNVVATDCQKTGEWSSSGIGFRPAACCVPGALNCKSMTA